MLRREIAWFGHRPDHKSFRPFVTAIGQSAVAWNCLHEALRALFVTVMDGNDDNTEPKLNAKWYSIRSDRGQRQLLMDALKSIERADALNVDDPDELWLGDAINDIFWLLKEVDSVADVRNDVVHAPLMSLSGTISPMGDYQGHPRALNLLRKDLLKEFRWCRDVTIVLTDFCIRMDYAIAESGRLPWPDLPNLPLRPAHV